jgi:hypothetical protein
MIILGEYLIKIGNVKLNDNLEDSISIRLLDSGN